MYFSINRIKAGGSRFENSTKGKALVLKIITPLIIEAIITFKTDKFISLYLLFYARGVKSEL